METRLLDGFDVEEEPLESCETKVWEEPRPLLIRPDEAVVVVVVSVDSLVSALARELSSSLSPLASWSSFGGVSGGRSSSLGTASLGSLAIARPP